MKGAYTFVRFFWIGILIQNSSCFELNIGKTVSYSSGSTQVTVEQKSESQNLYTHKLQKPLQLKEIWNGDKKIYLDPQLVSDQLLLSASVIWSFNRPSIVQLNLDKASLLLLNEHESSLDVQAIFSEAVVTNINPRIHSSTEPFVDVNLSNLQDYVSENATVKVTKLEIRDPRFKRYELRTYSLESAKIRKLLHDSKELSGEPVKGGDRNTETPLRISTKDDVYAIRVYSYDGYPLLMEVLYTYSKRAFFGNTPEKKWHQVLFPSSNDPSFPDFLLTKLNYYACKNGFKYTIDIKHKTDSTDQAYSMNNYCVESDRVETIENSLKASFYQDEKFKSAGYGCVEHTASNGHKFFVDHLMANTSVLQFPKTPSFTKAIRVYNRMNKRHYLIGFVDELDKLIYYKYENGEWTEETSLSKDKNERLSEEIKLLLDKLSEKDATTFNLEDVSDPDKATREDLDQAAIDESNIVYKITTFIVEKKTGYSSSVTVTPKPNHPATGFSKYTHDPTPKPCQKSLVLYKGKKLLKWDNTQSKLLAIDEVQEKQLNNIDVYFSDSIDFPLLTGVFQSDNTIDYYFVKRNGDRVSWQLLDEPALKGFINENIKKNEMHTKLTENKNWRLIQLLKKIALSVVDTVLVLVDKREAYDRTDASDAYKMTLNTDAANFSIGTFQPESISVTSVDVPSLKLSNFKCFEHTIRPTGTGSYQVKLLIPFQHMSIVNNNTVFSYRYLEIELYKSDNISDNNREELTFKKGDIKLYVYYYGEDPRPLLMCYENKVYRTKRLGEPERYNQVRIDYNKWSRLTDIDGCAHNVGAGNTASDANDQKILDALIEVVQYFNPVMLNLEKLPKEQIKQVAEANDQTTTDQTANYIIHDLKENCKVTMKLSSSKMETYRIHTYEHNGLENQNNPAGFTLGDVIFKGVHGGYNPYRINYDKTTQAPDKKMRHLVKVTGYFHTFDSDFQDPLLVILEFNDGAVATANTKEYYKLTVRSNDIPGTMEWVRDDDEVAKIIADQNQLLDYLNNLRYKLKYSAKMQIHFTRTTYPFSALNHEGTKEYPNLSGTQTSVTVSKESCPKLENKKFKCYKQEISSVKKSHLYYVTALKMSLPRKNEKDAVIQLFDETGQKQIDKLTYDYAYGDLYVYYYRNYNYPLMFCLKGSAFKPKDKDNYFSKWIKVKEIQKCDCTTLSTDEINQLEKTLDPIAKFMGLSTEKDDQRAKNILKMTVDKEALSYLTDTVKLTVLDNAVYIIDTFKKDNSKNKKLNFIDYDVYYHNSSYHIKWYYGKYGYHVLYAETNPNSAIKKPKYYTDLNTFPDGVYSHRVEWYKREGNAADIVILVYTNTLFVYKFRIEYAPRQWKHDTFKYRVSSYNYFFVGVEPVTVFDSQEGYSIYCERVKFINKVDFDSAIPNMPKTSKEALRYLHEEISPRRK
ncbi:hypothetical protein MACJ_001778 [Theileria orientalis]|uniref:Uncharacterized protein n=1 Tax=Theileria orientalis TaxID=68886 RepID=A0A976M984_THEOR|nr:hypothetical protein MACJ_001778 [Theileria orientalis]